MTQPEALRLADLLEPCWLTIGDAQQAVAAAELRRNCSKCKANRPALNGRTNKITRLWRCAACLQQETKK